MPDVVSTCTQQDAQCSYLTVSVMPDVSSTFTSRKAIKDIRVSSNSKLAKTLMELKNNLPADVSKFAKDDSHLIVIEKNFAVSQNQSSSLVEDSRDSILNSFANRTEKMPIYRMNEQNTISIEYDSDEISQSSSIQKTGFFEVANDIEPSTTLSLLQIMKQDDFIAGENSNTEAFIRSIAETVGWVKTVNWLQKVTLDHFNDSPVVEGILHSISHFAYVDMNPGGVFIALGVLQHKDIYVRDCAIRAFENWNSKQAIPVLESLSCEAEWQQQYINDVLTTLKAEGIE